MGIEPLLCRTGTTDRQLDGQTDRTDCFNPTLHMQAREVKMLQLVD